MLNNLVQQNNNGLAFKVSYGETVRSKLQEVPFHKILHSIRTGEDILEQIQQVRTIDDEEKRRQKKEQILPAFSMGLFCDSRHKNTLLKCIRYIVLDFDHLEARLAKVKEQLTQDAEVYCTFVSPSGDGLKIICKLDRDVTDHKEYTKIYEHYAELFSERYKHPYDKTKDAARLCFFSYDADIYVNEKATPLKAELPLNGQATRQNKRSNKGVIAKALAGTDVGNRTHTVTQMAGILQGRGLTQDFALPLVNAWNKQNAEPLPEDKICRTVADIYDRYGEEGALANYWSYGKDIFDIGIINSNFYMEKNPINKVYVRAGALTEEDKMKTYAHLVTVKHIPHLARINFLGDVGTEESYYEYLPEQAVIDVHHAPLPVKLRDNQFIENYLEGLFGKYKQFIKEWLAVYCYSNYRKLPFLILTGKRGSGKNTFAEMVAEIFPTISTMWHGEEKNFNPEVEMKLLIADETVSNDPHQYKTLKKHSGQKEIVVNHKYLKPYQVRNSINVMILSNASTPIFVERDEYPTSEENNQFFVFDFAPLTGELDETLRDKLKDRLGNYLRTELKTVFHNLKMDGKRYSIKVPITPKERALFVNSITNVDIVVDQYVERIIKEYSREERSTFVAFVNAKCLNSNFFDGYTLERSGVTRADVIKKFVERGYLVSAEMNRKKLPKIADRPYVYLITPEFKSRIQKEAKPEGNKKKPPVNPNQLSMPIVATPWL